MIVANWTVDRATYADLASAGRIDDVVIVDGGSLDNEYRRTTERWTTQDVCTDVSRTRQSFNDGNCWKRSNKTADKQYNRHIR